MTLSSEEQEQTKKKHIHKFEKIIVGGRKIEKRDGKRYIVKVPGKELMKCTLKNCPTFIIPELAEGRLSLCWYCGEELTLTKENMKLKHPTHVYCRRVKEKM
jgi:hypothetical protein